MKRENFDFKIGALKHARAIINNATFEEQYFESLVNILVNGKSSADRTGVGTTKIVGQSFKIDLTKTMIPILSGKKMNFKSALTEIVWILKGDTNTKFLKENGVNYWDDWADENGNLGKIYGHQMRSFDDRYDQLRDVINTLIDNPISRRILISLWNPNQYNEQSLIPCHGLYHFNTYVKNNRTTMDLVVYQRSADSFLGIPYDFMLFSLMLQIIGYYTCIDYNTIHVNTGDYHIYNNHHDAVNKYLENCSQDPKGIFEAYERNGNYPKFMDLSKILPTYHDASLDEFIEILSENIETISQSLIDYNHYPFIKASVAV